MIEVKQNWTFHEKGKKKRMEAVVPGCVHTDLIRNGIIEDPFFRLTAFFKPLKWQQGLKSTFYLFSDTLFVR